MLNIHRFKLDKHAKSKTKTTHFTKQKHVLTRVTWFFDRGRNDKTYKRASSFDFNSSQMSSKLFSLVPANYLILFLSMCACNLFNVRQAWIESHAGRPLKKSAIKQFEVVLKEFCVIHERQGGRHVRAWTFLFIARRERNVWFHGSQTSGRRF